VGIAQRFPKAGGNEGNLGLVFLVFHGALRFSCALTLVPEAEEEFPLGFLHSPGCLGVAVLLAIRSKPWMLSSGLR